MLLWIAMSRMQLVTQDKTKSRGDSESRRLIGTEQRDSNERDDLIEMAKEES